MAIYKDGAFIADPWRTIDEGEDVPPAGHIILPLDWWLAEREVFTGSHAPLGLLVEPGTGIEDFITDLDRFALIALAFPKFGDGRAFSLARLLRSRHGFAGELRATGEVLFDQIQHMQRCGFDSFDISNEATIRALQAGRHPGVAHFYQPSLASEAAAGTRPWLRRSLD